MQKKGFFSLLVRDIPENLIDIYRLKYVWVQASAFALTYLLVASDFDWIYYQAMHGKIPFAAILPAISVGGILPIVLPLALWAIARVRKSATLFVFAATIGQSAFLGWLVSSFYKSLTGRVPPQLRVELVSDISKQFQFGFLRGGIFWGWPSSHTTVAFAMAFATCAFFPKNRLLQALCVLYALYVGLSVSVSIHWFSEFVAGALIGAVIGLAVGRRMRKRV